jgi:hypothetical protein
MRLFLLAPTVAGNVHCLPISCDVDITLSRIHADAISTVQTQVRTAEHIS